MLNEKTIKITLKRDFLKKRRSNKASSPKVKVSCSSKQIDEQEYYKPAAELIYNILKGMKDNER